MTNAGLDRRILKAFYTQYVAVLLIVLTFTVGAFQRATQARRENPSASVTSPAAFYSPARTIWNSSLENVFSLSGAVKDTEGELSAISEVLKSHDLNLNATLKLKRFEPTEESPSFRRAMIRAEALERFFVNREVPASALTIKLEQNTDAVESISLEIVTEGRPHD